MNKQKLIDLRRGRIEHETFILDMIERMPLKGPLIRILFTFRVIGTKWFPKNMDMLVIPHDYNNESLKAQIMASPQEYPLFFSDKTYSRDKQGLGSLKFLFIHSWEICPRKDYAKYICLPFVSPEFSLMLKGDTNVLLPQQTETCTA